jgi:hypothetical protein
MAFLNPPLLLPQLDIESLETLDRLSAAFGEIDTQLSANSESTTLDMVSLSAPLLVAKADKLMTGRLATTFWTT